MHLYGTSLGGFLAQLFAHHRPRRVKSLVLSNTYLDTRSFAAAMPWAPLYVSLEELFILYFFLLVPGHFILTLYHFWGALCSVSWTPSFLLKRYVLTGIRDGPHEPFIADSVDFAVSQVALPVTFIFDIFLKGFKLHVKNDFYMNLPSWFLWFALI